MSKRKQSRTQTRRFSGPELSELLDRVVSEHGSAAAISSVNRIRSGGVAGFFCREEFEVVVDTPAPATTTEQSTQQNKKQKNKKQKSEKPRSRKSKTNKTDLDRTVDRTAETPSETAPGPMAPANTTEMPRAEVDPLERIRAASRSSAPVSDIAPSKPGAARLRQPRPVPAESVASNPASRHHYEAVIPTDDGASEVFGGPRPRRLDGTDERFMALLEQRLDQASVGVDRPRSRERVVAPEAPRRTEPSLQPIVPAPGLSMETAEPSGGIGMLTATVGPSSGFWLRLQRAQHELASFMPLASSSVAIVGPLSLTTPIVARLRAQPGFSGAAVIVLTDRAEIVSEPSWQLVRSGHQLLDAVEDGDGRPMLLVVDVPVELPNWVAPLQNRLRMAGVGLFRYAVPGTPGPADLDQYRQGSDVPYVLDLVSRIRPRHLVELIEMKHPVASVAGADLNAELLVAMREQVGIG